MYHLRVSVMGLNGVVHPGMWCIRTVGQEGGNGTRAEPEWSYPLLNTAAHGTFS